jgi:hypothetical protein
VLQAPAYIVILFSSGIIIGTADKARLSADKRVLARRNGRAAKSLGEPTGSKFMTSCSCCRAMSETHYGTDHERYLGAGIVSLSQIAETSRYDKHLCEKERKEIDGQFQRGACQPWPPEGRLKAEVSRSHWEARIVMDTKRLENYDFPKLRFSSDDVVTIMGSVARLEAVRASSASGLVNMFNRLDTQERCWVVDLFEQGTSGWAIRKKKCRRRTLRTGSTTSLADFCFPRWLTQRTTCS